MKSKQLAPYILISILIHVGALAGIHRFLNWPAAEQAETETLVPVEVVVLPETPEVNEPELAAASRAPDDSGLHTGSRRMETAGYRRPEIEPLEPAPLPGDLRPGLPSGGIVLPALTIATQKDAAAGSVAVAAAGKMYPPAPVLKNRIAASPPEPKENAGEPQLTVKSSPELRPMLWVPRSIAVKGDAAIPAYRSAAADISIAEAIPPPASPVPGVKPAAEFQEAAASPGPHAARVLQGSAAAPAETLPTGQPIPGSGPPPTEVSEEPRMMVASLKLKSHPSGAQVFVDDLPSGETPVDMKLPVGKHEFRLVLPGHYDWKAQIELTDRNRPYPIFPRLLPIE